MRELVRSSLPGLKTGVLTIFTFDDVSFSGSTLYVSPVTHLRVPLSPAQMHSDDVVDLTKSQVRHAYEATEGAMSAIAGAFATAPYGVSVKQANYAASDMAALTREIARTCSTTYVADGMVYRDVEGALREGQLTRADFERSLSAPAQGCRAFFVPLRRASVDAELSFATRAASAASLLGPSVAVVTADPALSVARRLGALPTSTVAAYYIYMTPTIVEGLLVSLVLIFFLAVGLSCVTSIQNPDRLFSTNSAIPIGKEY